MMMAMLALRSLLRRKVRSVLTVVGVAIGVGAVVAMITVARGFRAQFNSFFAAGDAHLVVSRKGAADPFLSYLPDSLIERLRAAEGVAEVHPFIFAIKQIRFQPLFFFYGTTEGSPFLSRLKVVSGRSIFEIDSDRRVLCIGRTAAEHMDLDVGSILEIDDEDYVVAGIFESSVAFLDSGGLMRFADVQRVTGMNHKMNSALIRLDHFDRDRIDEVAKGLEAAFPSIEASAPAEFSQVFDEFELAEQAVTVFSIIAIFIGGIGVMNTMLMSVFERTREIGILRAIGWGRGLILRQILTEGLLISLLGGALGVALGMGIVEGVGSLAGFGWIAGDYGPIIFIQSLTVAVGMGLFGTLYPAWRAVRITPIEALRYE